MADAMRILVAIFPSREAVIDAVDHLVEAALFHVGRSAVIAKAADGETVVIENRVTPDEAGIAGGTLGALMGGALGMTQLGAIILPGVGPILAVGAGVLAGGLLGRQTGRFAAHLISLGFTEEQIESLSKRLKEGQAALVVEVETEQDLGRIRQSLSKLDVELIERLDDIESRSLL